MRRLLFVVGVVFLLIFLGLFFLLKVKEVSCATDGPHACPQSLQDDLQQFVGRRLLGTSSAIDALLSKTASVSTFRKSVSPLGVVSVEVSLRKPVIVLKAQGSEYYSAYTEGGVYVWDTKENTLPIVELREQIETKNIPYIVEFANTVVETLPVSKMNASGVVFQVELLDGKVLYYPIPGDIDVLVGSTLVVFSQLNQQDGKLMINGDPVQVKEIDFRFKNPVLR